MPLQPTQKDGPIARLFKDDDGSRQASLDRARVCAALTLPWMCPPSDQSESDRLPDNYQSLGAHGSKNLVGRLLSAVWPIGAPWAKTEIAPHLLHGNQIPLDIIREMQDALFIRDIIVQAALESVGRRQSPGIPTGFYTAKRTALAYLAVTGDVLEHVDDENRIHPKRRDMYVTRRDGDGSVAYHVIHDAKDVLGLDDETLAKAGINRGDFQGRHRQEREYDLWTMVEWQPRTKKWVITQELNGQEINRSEETYSPYLSSTWDHNAPEHYGRGLIEENLADLRAFDNVSEYILQWAMLASKHHPCIDPASEMDPRDLTRPSGEPIVGPRMDGGKPQDVGWLSVERLADFTIVEKVRADLKESLGKILLLTSGGVRDSERTTAYEIAEITIKELEGALGTVYSSVADEQQIPLISLITHRLERSGRLPKLPRDSISVQTTTGLAALAREADARRVLRFLDSLKGLPPEVAALVFRRIDDGVLTEHLARSGGVFVPGLIKSRQQLEQELQKAQAEQAKMAMAGKAIDTMGNIVEKQAAPAAA